MSVNPHQDRKLSKPTLTNIPNTNLILKYPILTNIIYSLNVYRLVLVNISKGTFFQSLKILTDFNQYFYTIKNIS